MNFTGVFVIIGIMVGIAIAMVLLSIGNKNGKVRTEYDERQEAIRGRGYKYGMYSAWICIGLYLVCEIGEVNLHMEPAVAAFSILAISAIVQCTHAVFNDAYFGNNSDAKRYFIIFSVISILDIIGSVRYYQDGNLIVDGVLTWRGISPIVSAMMVVLLVEIAIKSIMDKKSAEEEEE